MQNLPSRGPNGKKLKKSILAPEGYTLIDADSAQIEARVLAWFAEQDDLTAAFAAGEDVYVKMASRIYGCEEKDVTKDQRFVGKTTILGAGYGMGAVKFQAQLKNFGFEVELGEARRIINIYRESNWKINHLWRNCQNMIRHMVNGDSVQVGKAGVLATLGSERAIRLPSGLLLRYNDLSAEQAENGLEYSYKTRRGRTRIYGGKATENLCQAIARCIIGEQMLQINKKYRVVLTVHDSIVACVKDEEVDEAQAYIEKCMRYVPTWAAGLPIDCESGTGKSYGDCE
jgi:DNA polymerase